MKKKRLIAVLALVIMLVIGAVVCFSRPKNTETPATPEPTAETANNTNTETPEPTVTATPATDTQQPFAQPTETTQQENSTAEPEPSEDTPIQVTDTGDVVIELEEDEETFGE
ncbi:MAG: hypothetical protein IJJ44_03115 [Solobacterium sp.]|nr:hypothetical protein [Solobacterium sp.]